MTTRFPKAYNSLTSILSSIADCLNNLGWLGIGELRHFRGKVTAIQGAVGLLQDASALCSALEQFL